MPFIRSNASGTTEQLNQLDQMLCEAGASVLEIPVDYFDVTFTGDLRRTKPDPSKIHIVVEGLYSREERTPKLMEELVEALVLAALIWAVKNGAGMKFIEATAATSKTGYIHASWSQETGETTFNT